MKTRANKFTWGYDVKKYLSIFFLIITWKKGKFFYQQNRYLNLKFAVKT